MQITEEARQRIKWMSNGTKRWFASDFDENSDLDDATVLDFVTCDPDWVVGGKELTPLGREVYRLIKTEGGVA